MSLNLILDASKGFIDCHDLYTSINTAAAYAVIYAGQSLDRTNK